MVALGIEPRSPGPQPDMLTLALYNLKLKVNFWYFGLWRTRLWDHPLAIPETEKMEKHARRAIIREALFDLLPVFDLITMVLDYTPGMFFHLTSRPQNCMGVFVWRETLDIHLGNKHVYQREEFLTSPRLVWGLSDSHRVEMTQYSRFRLPLGLYFFSMVFCRCSLGNCHQPASISLFLDTSTNDTISIQFCEAHAAELDDDGSDRFVSEFEPREFKLE